MAGIFQQRETVRAASWLEWYCLIFREVPPSISVERETRGEFSREDIISFDGHAIDLWRPSFVLEMALLLGIDRVLLTYFDMRYVLSVVSTVCISHFLVLCPRRNCCLFVDVICYAIITRYTVHSCFSLDTKYHNSTLFRLDIYFLRYCSLNHTNMGSYIISTI